MEFVLASQRKSTRRAVRVDCQVIREKDFKLLGQSALNISADGLLLKSRFRAQKGEALLISFRVPGTNQWIDTEATVARFESSDSPRKAHTIGVAFESLDSESKRLLRAKISRFPPTLPTRPRRIDYAATAQLIALG